jgi:transcription termination factor NusB
MFLHVISTPLAPGIYNAVAPDSVSQKALMQKLRQIFGTKDTPAFINGILDKVSRTRTQLTQ